MSSTADDLPVPDFEIDHRNEYAQYLLSDPQEISHYLKQLSNRGKLLSAHLDGGKQFFLTALVAVDDDRGVILFDTAQAEALNRAAVMAKQVTLTANLDRIKIQFRLPGLREQSHEGRRVLAAAMPGALLRLQRREYFRLTPPVARPLVCQIHLEQTDGSLQTLHCGVSDISCGGISLTVPMINREDCSRDALFHDSRLEIPDEGVLLVNLRVRKTVEFSADDRQHYLRVGCEFIGLPSSRLAMIQRYIARVERERTARTSGLAD